MESLRKLAKAGEAALASDGDEAPKEPKPKRKAAEQAPDKKGGKKGGKKKHKAKAKTVSVDEDAIGL
jgi:hypothetical protein